MSDNTLTEHQDGSATLGSDRHMVCLQAAFELEALAGILPGLVPDHEPSHLTVRIRSLWRVLMSGLSDDSEPVAYLEREVFGTAQREAA